MPSQFPILKIEVNNGCSMPAALHRTVVAFEKAILECHFQREKSAAISGELEERAAALRRFYVQLEELVVQACFKGKQTSRVYEVYGWNVGLLTNQHQLLIKCHLDCDRMLNQVRLGILNRFT